MTIMLRERELCRWLAELQQGGRIKSGCVARCALALAVLALTAVVGAAGFPAGHEVSRWTGTDVNLQIHDRAAGHRRALFEQRRQQFGAHTALAGNDDRVMELSDAAKK